MDKLLRMNISRYTRNVDHESAAVQALRKHLSRDSIYVLVDLVAGQAKGTFDCIEDRNIMLTIVIIT